MLSRTEIERLAAMGNALRPDWPVRSLLTLIHSSLANRAYRDVAVALAWIACDPTTATPGRLLELGDWWIATRITGSAAVDAIPRPSDPRCEEHPWARASNCAACRSEEIAVDPDAPRVFERTPAVPERRVRQIIAAATVVDVRKLAAGDTDDDD